MMDERNPPMDFSEDISERAKRISVAVISTIRRTGGDYLAIYQAVRDALIAAELRTAPASCSHEADCGSVDICRALAASE